MEVATLEQYIDYVRVFDQPEQLDRWWISIAPDLTPEQSQGIRVRDNYLPGCQNPVWISGIHTDTGWQFALDSHSKITLGVGKMLKDVYNNKTAAQVKQISYHDFKPIAQTFSVPRQRGLQMMINRIHNIVDNKESQQ